MDTKNYAIALPAAAGLAAVLLLTACGGGISTSSHPSAGTTTSPAAARAASTVTVTDQDDSNWAGYVVGNSATAKTSFSAVSGSWTQPAADCAAGSPSHSAFWVGLGGYTGDHLEQTGTSADCSASGQASYSAWYELVPAAQVPVTMTVRPGDRLSAHVAVSGTTVTISLSDLTRHATFSKQLPMSSPTVSSAEWIAEAPSRCLSSSSQDCHILSLAASAASRSPARARPREAGPARSPAFPARSTRSRSRPTRLRPPVRHRGAGGRVARRPVRQRLVVHRHLAAPGDPDAGPACHRVRSYL